MNDLARSVFLVLSGGLIVASILLSKIGFDRSTLSLGTSAIYSAIGAGLGCAIFVFFGISNGDLFGSVCTGSISAFTIGLTTYLFRKRKNNK
jgi:ABC-type Fe3+-siderophore transport system permease subunit